MEDYCHRVIKEKRKDMRFKRGRELRKKQRTVVKNINQRGSSKTMYETRGEMKGASVKEEFKVR